LSTACARAEARGLQTVEPLGHAVHGDLTDDDEEIWPWSPTPRCRRTRTRRAPRHRGRVSAGEPVLISTAELTRCRHAAPAWPAQGTWPNVFLADTIVPAEKTFSNLPSSNLRYSIKFSGVSVGG
jgi:hypothetical protein